MTDFIVAGGLSALLLLAMLVYGALHVGVKVMAFLDVAKTLVADLKGLNLASVLQELKAAPGAAVAAVEAEGQALVAELESEIAAIKAELSPPAPAAEEHPAA